METLELKGKQQQGGYNRSKNRKFERSCLIFQAASWFSHKLFNQHFLLFNFCIFCLENDALINLELLLIVAVLCNNLLFYSDYFKFWFNLLHWNKTKPSTRIFNLLKIARRKGFEESCFPIAPPSCFVFRELRAEVEALKEMLLHAAQPGLLKEKLSENEKLVQVNLVLEKLV